MNWILRTEMAHESYMLDFPKEVLMINRTTPEGINLSLESGRAKYGFAGAWKRNNTGQVVVFGDYELLLEYQDKLSAAGLPEEFKSALESIVQALEKGEVIEKKEYLRNRL